MIHYFDNFVFQLNLCFNLIRAIEIENIIIQAEQTTKGGREGLVSRKRSEVDRELGMGTLKASKVDRELGMGTLKASKVDREVGIGTLKASKVGRDLEMGTLKASKIGRELGMGTLKASMEVNGNFRVNQHR